MGLKEIATRHEVGLAKRHPAESEEVSEIEHICKYVLVHLRYAIFVNNP